MFIRLVAVLLSAILIFNSVLPARAQVQTYDLTDRGVFRLTASGAAKIGLAESQIATAVRLLGMLGRVSTVVTVGFAAYEITSGLWDWWSRTYNQGAVGDLATGTMTKGVQGGVGVGDCIAWQRNTYQGVEAFYSLQVQTCPAGAVFVGQTFNSYFQGDVFVQQMTLHFVSSYGVSLSPISDAVAGAAGREAFLSAIDAATVALQANTPEDIALAATFTSGDAYNGQQGVAGALAALAAARGVVSSGVGMDSGDVEIVNVGASVGALPGAIPGAGEGSEVGNSAVAAAIGAAIAAAAAAAASGYASVVSAILASQTAVVSAVQAVAAPIVAAILASQAAVVSAVQSVTAAVSAVTSHVDDVKMAVEGVKSSVDELKAQEAAPDTTVPAEAPAFVCPVCTRVTSWATLFGSLQSTAAAAPIFSLVGRLVWPGVGSVARTWTIGSWQGQVMSVDLEASGIATVITVVRFVVVGGAVIVAYMIIFG